MSSEIIKKYLEKVKNENKYDVEFISILENCNENSEDGEITAGKIIHIIGKRYAENKENKT